MQVQRLVGDQCQAGLLDRGDRWLDEGLRPDVVTEGQRDPLVPELLGDHDHRIGLGEVGRHQPVEVIELDAIEL